MDLKDFKTGDMTGWEVRKRDGSDEIISVWMSCKVEDVLGNTESHDEYLSGDARDLALSGDEGKATVCNDMCLRAYKNILDRRANEGIHVTETLDDVIQKPSKISKTALESHIVAVAEAKQAAIEAAAAEALAAEQKAKAEADAALVPHAEEKVADLSADVAPTESKPLEGDPQ